QVGRLMAEIHTLGLYEDTMIVLTGDHGEGLGEHGELYHGIFLYNATMRIPLIIRTPGGRRGTTVTDLSSTIDITPTVLDALKIPPESAMEGVSLLPAAAKGSRVPARSLYLETIYASSSYGWAASRAILEPLWKLIDL